MEGRDACETGSPGPDGPEYPPELVEEVPFVDGGATFEITADSRDVADSNLFSVEMSTIPVDCFSESGAEFERADSFRRSFRISARC